jgi:hypothetical protein
MLSGFVVLLFYIYLVFENLLNNSLYLVVVIVAVVFCLILKTIAI